MVKKQKVEKKSEKKSEEIERIFGFIIAEYEKINLYIYKNKDFVLDNGNLRKVIDKKSLNRKKNMNKIHGMLKYEG